MEIHEGAYIKLCLTYLCENIGRKLAEAGGKAKAFTLWFGRDRTGTALAYEGAYPLPLPSSVEGEGTHRAGDPEHEGLGRFRV